MLARLPYEDVYVAACKVDPKAARCGMEMHKLQSIAKLCGVTLVRRRAFDLETDVGILSVREASGGKHWWHMVILANGCIVDPDGARFYFDASDYLAENNARACSLLVAA